MISKLSEASGQRKALNYRFHKTDTPRKNADWLQRSTRLSNAKPKGCCSLPGWAQE